jgi:Kef-type K+ transport system membrane component KefB
MRYCTTYLPVVALLANLSASGSAPFTFLKIFLAVAAFVCLAVLILRFLGRLLIDLFGILDSRSPTSRGRYA